MHLWLKELTTLPIKSTNEKGDTCIRETDLNANPDSGELENNKPENERDYQYVFCTANHQYRIHVTPTYLGCTATSRVWRAGEDWHRGNDLPDGKFCRRIWERIKNAIIQYELVKLEEPVEYIGVDETEVTEGTVTEDAGYITTNQILCAVHKVPMILHIYNRGPNDPPGNAMVCPQCVEERKAGAAAASVTNVVATGVPGPCPCGQGYDDDGDGNCAVCGPEKERQAVK